MIYEEGDERAVNFCLLYTCTEYVCKVSLCSIYDETYVSSILTTKQKLQPLQLSHSEAL